MPKPICLIPARSGSKGLPHKNMLFLDGKPMIFHTIDAAIKSGCFDKKDIYVSTDSPLYQQICQERGINAVLRPASLAGDLTTSFEVNEHFLQDFADDQVFVLLQATSPLRDAKHIQEALALYNQGQAENVVSVCQVDKSPRLFTTLDDNGYAQDIVGIDKGYRRQNHQAKLYAPNGAIFISQKDTYLRNQSYFTAKTQAYIMDKQSSIDVDERLDFTDAIGRIYFNYSRRDLKNQAFYRNNYQSFVAQSTKNRVIVGDSRLVDFAHQDYDNFSQGGITIATILANHDVWLSHHPTHVLVSAGVNDLIVGHAMDNIKANFDALIDAIKARNSQAILTQIPLTLFRDSVNNDDIATLNTHLQGLAQTHALPYIAPNDILATDGHLRYELTSDGLHFNAQGQALFFDKIFEQLATIS